MPIDVSTAWKSAERILNGAIGLLPNLILAALMFAVFVVLASASKSLVRRFTLRKNGHANLALLLGRLTQATLLFVGLLVAFAIVAPSFQAGDVIKLLGVGGVAIGFAFRDILQNFLAGILLLVQEPFRVGDQITMDTFAGAVEDIQGRATLLKASDGRRVIIPNSDLFTHTVIVQSGSGERPGDA